MATLTPVSRLRVMTVVPPTDPPVCDTIASPRPFVVERQPIP